MNLHVLKWGTREDSAGKKNKEGGNKFVTETTSYGLIVAGFNLFGVSVKKNTPKSVHSGGSRRSSTIEMRENTSVSGKLSLKRRVSSAGRPNTIDEIRIRANTMLMDELPGYMVPVSDSEAVFDQNPTKTSSEYTFWRWLVNDTDPIIKNMPGIEESPSTSQTSLSQDGPLKPERSANLTKMRPSEKRDYQAKQKSDSSDLFALRSQFLTIFFGLNVTWLILNLVIEIELQDDNFVFSDPMHLFDSCKGKYNETSVEQEFLSGCEDSTINPLSFFFLLGYLILLSIQFVCMLYHRWSMFLLYIQNLKDGNVNIYEKIKTENKKNGNRKHEGIFLEVNAVDNLARENSAFENEVGPTENISEIKVTTL